MYSKSGTVWNIHGSESPRFPIHSLPLPLVFLIHFCCLVTDDNMKRKQGKD